ncbi:MAG: hypothetical protein IJO06_04925 [Thermoguttaceae bacterium]|nr:hypothetical protein [Thermoguttaceae bacterium]
MNDEQAKAVDGTREGDDWFRTCQVEPKPFEWIEGAYADGKTLRMFRTDSVGWLKVWKNAELQTVDPPVRWRYFETDAKTNNAEAYNERI